MRKPLGDVIFTLCGFAALHTSPTTLEDVPESVLHAREVETRLIEFCRVLLEGEIVSSCRICQLARLLFACSLSLTLKRRLASLLLLVEVARCLLFGLSQFSLCLFLRLFERRRCLPHSPIQSVLQFGEVGLYVVGYCDP